MINGNKNKIKKIGIAVLFLPLVSSFILFGANVLFPDNMRLYAGEKISRFGIYSIQRVENSANAAAVLSNEENPQNAKVMAFGTIPVKDVSLQVEEPKQVIVGGQTVGVKLMTKGVLVIGFSSMKSDDGARTMPAKDAGLKEGDVIVSANGNEVTGTEQFMSLIEQSGGNEMELGILRKEKALQLKIRPTFSQKDGRYRLGAYIRDSSAGIGTLTFISPDNKSFAALGHGITDVDTGEILKVSQGSITNAAVIGIVKGEKGSPGELKGVMSDSKTDIGKIQFNNEFGIFGSYQGEYDTGKLKTVLSRNAIKEGKACILCCIDGQTVEEFEVEIIKVAKQTQEMQKGMVIKVTDPKLLEATGGIVQGMSGSPILQDDKLVGAVTHVFINDPTKGYGIFADWMLDETQKVN